MNYIYAKVGQRLDEIAYKYYGTLANFAEVLAHNANLNTILKEGDKVYLPPYVAPKVEVMKLW